MDKQIISEIEPVTFDIHMRNGRCLVFSFEYHRRGTICTVRQGWNIIGFAVAWLNPKDAFDVTTGELESLRRVLDKIRLYIPEVGKKAIFDAYFRVAVDRNKREAQNAANRQNKRRANLRRRLLKLMSKPLPLPLVNPGPGLPLFVERYKKESGK